jgi:hypothetical protein
LSANTGFQQLRDTAWLVEHNYQDDMNHDVDLDDALSFVVKRIEEEATLSGKLLTEEEGLLLNNLPTTPLFPMTASSDPEFLVPRDLAYERLIALQKRRGSMTFESIPYQIANGDTRQQFANSISIPCRGFCSGQE